MNKSICFILVTMMFFCLCACTDEKKDTAVPEKHVIPYDETMETLHDGEGADAFDSKLDHKDSRYYTLNDYYNMESGNGLHILSEFQTYQQTTEYSCGCASALMVLNYFDNHDYNETDLCRLANTDTTKGTSVEGLVSFFESLGWDITFHADTESRFLSIEEAEAFFLDALDAGHPVMVNWVDWGGHWQVAVGLDTCETDNPYDDVLILADPYDVTDHYQDGYFIEPFGRFFDMWREGPCTGKVKPYEQPFVIASPVK